MLSSVSGIPSFLFVAWTDPSATSTSLTRQTTRQLWRKDRGDTQDIEVLLHYSVDRFIKV